MRSVRWSDDPELRHFDALFAHDAVMYLTTEPDLKRALDRAHVHCKPGGGAPFLPDAVAETWKPDTHQAATTATTAVCVTCNGAWTPDPEDRVFWTDLVYLLRHGHDPTRVVAEHHELGPLPRATWLRLLKAAGFQARSPPIEHSTLRPGSWEGFLALRRA
jgi:hypothetical protein